MAKRPEIVTVMYLFTWKQQKRGVIWGRGIYFDKSSETGCLPDATEGKEEELSAGSFHLDARNTRGGFAASAVHLLTQRGRVERNYFASPIVVS